MKDTIVIKTPDAYSFNIAVAIVQTLRKSSRHFSKHIKPGAFDEEFPSIYITNCNVDAWAYKIEDETDHPHISFITVEEAFKYFAKVDESIIDASIGNHIILINKDNKTVQLDGNIYSLDIIDRIKNAAK